MKKYIVGVNVAAGEITIKAYESKDVQSNKNTNGLTYQSILGGYFNPMFESTRKDEVMNFIKKTYPASEGWRISDYSSRVIRGQR